MTTTGNCDINIVIDRTINTITFKKWHSAVTEDKALQACQHFSSRVNRVVHADHGYIESRRPNRSRLGVLGRRPLAITLCINEDIAEGTAYGVFIVSSEIWRAHPWTPSFESWPPLRSGAAGADDEEEAALFGGARR